MQKYGVHVVTWASPTQPWGPIDPSTSSPGYGGQGAGGRGGGLELLVGWLVGWLVRVPYLR